MTREELDALERMCRAQSGAGLSPQLDGMVKLIAEVRRLRSALATIAGDEEGYGVPWYIDIAVGALWATS